MKRGFRAFSLIVFFIGIGAFSVAWQKGEPDVEPSRPFVTVSCLVDSTPDGTKTITGWRTRYVQANGEFRIVGYGMDKAAAFASDGANPGGPSAVIAGTNEGVYVRPSGSAGRLSVSSTPAENAWDATVPEKHDKLYHSRSFLRNMPNFARMDKVAELDVYVTRTNVDGGYWIEASYSPLTGRTPLRMVWHMPDGTEYGIETVKVDFRDVPSNLNEDIKALPTTGNMGDQIAPSKKQN